MVARGVYSRSTTSATFREIVGLCAFENRLVRPAEGVFRDACLNLGRDGHTNERQCQP